MQEFKFDYDSENDDLFVYSPKHKTSASVELGKLILDFDSSKRLSGIEIMDATSFLKNLINRLDVNKDALSKIISCKVDSKSQDNMIFIKMAILLAIKEKRVEIPISMPVPRITDRSPALAC